MLFTETSGLSDDLVQTAFKMLLDKVHKVKEKKENFNTRIELK